MELEQIQALWDEMSAKVDNQNILTDKLIIDMTQERYRNKISKISKYESIGAIVCFIAAIGILVNLSQLDTWYLLATGLFSAGYLILIPVMVLRSIIRLKSVNILKNNLKQTITDFTKRRKHFLFMQRLGIYLNFLLMFVSLPVIVKLMDGKDLFESDTDVWYWYIPIMAVFLILFSRWGYGHYSRMSESAGNLLKELDG
ncbi:hypothetical protein [uncultured Croceitalea sp.]|uniref:hypothetical protein n=1 Tax=uncultured Croceitalea sp. TaxID=1798908 RepID=UPI0033068DB1